LFSFPYNFSTSETDLVSCRTVATKDDILVPETLLKKRKSQEKAREDRAAALKEKRGTHVRQCQFRAWASNRSDDINPHYD
jgi:hypothetical protein